MKKTWGRYLAVVIATAMGMASARAETAVLPAITSFEVAAAIQDSAQLRGEQLSELNQKIDAALKNLASLKVSIDYYGAHQANGRMIRRLTLAGVCMSIAAVMAMRTQISFGSSLTEAGGALGFVAYVKNVPGMLGDDVGTALGTNFVVLRPEELSKLEIEIGMAQIDLQNLKSSLQKISG